MVHFRQPVSPLDIRGTAYSGAVRAPPATWLKYLPFHACAQSSADQPNCIIRLLRVVYVYLRGRWTHYCWRHCWHIYIYIYISAVRAPAMGLSIRLACARADAWIAINSPEVVRPGGRRAECRTTTTTTTTTTGDDDVDWMHALYASTMNTCGWFRSGVRSIARAKIAHVFRIRGRTGHHKRTHTHTCRER